MSYEEVISFNNLYKGLKFSCNNVRWKDSTVGYESNILKNTYNLRKSLLDNSYKIDKYQKFTVYEPKRREIVATRLKDRQFQRSLCDNGLYEEITRHFIYDNGACIKGKGVDFTLNRITSNLRKYNLKYGNDGWVLKCDIYHYFQSISHNIAKEAVDKRVTDKKIVNCVYDIIDSFEGDCGLGLGSQVSQLIALAVLDDLDHYIKEELKIKFYIRYMDDFILVHKDKEYLKYCKNKITEKLNKIGLKLNKKTSISPIKNGINMLQWKFILTDSGAIIRKMNKRKQKKQRNKLKKIINKEKIGLYPIGAAKNSLDAWLSNLKRGNTYYERNKMIEYYNRLVGETNGKRFI